MSKITIANNTKDGEVVRIAIYKKPVLQPNLSTIAWQVVAPPPGGQQKVLTPDSYGAVANYSYDKSERNDPTAGSQTNSVSFAEFTARFIVGTKVSQDQRASAATLTQVFNDLVLNEVRIENRFGYGVWAHITADGDDIYAPQVLWPGAVIMQDIRASLYLAVVAQFVNKGDRLVDEEISLTEVEILEGGSAVVSGSMWEGYLISVS